MTFVVVSLLARPVRAAVPELAHSEPSASASPACPGGDTTVCGREQFEIGARAFEHGDLEAARHAFEAALSLRPHAVIRYNLALCWARSGKPTRAVHELEIVLGDGTIDASLRARSERELTNARRALSHVSFELADPTREYLEVDSERVQDGLRELALDPGTHHVRIVSGASVLLDQELEVSPGERVELRVGERTRRIDVLLVPEARPVVAPSPTAPDHASRGVRPIWFFAAAGATVALGGFTVWSGLNTQRALADYRRDLPSLSQGEADRRVSDGHERELRTNALLAASLVCAAGTAALGLWFVDFSATPSAHVALGLDRVSLRTTF